MTAGFADALAHLLAATRRPAAEKVCSVCETEKVRIREEVSEQIEYVPASLFVKQTVRPVYACPNEHEVTVMPAPVRAARPYAQALSDRIRLALPLVASGR